MGQSNGAKNGAREPAIGKSRDGLPNNLPANRPSLYKPAPTNHTETRQVSREWGQPLGNEAGISPVSRVMCLLLGSRVEVKQKRHTALGITVEYENLGHLGTPLLPGFDRLLLEDQFTPLGLEGFR